jgi:valyl-tRNA synthetase
MLAKYPTFDPALDDPAAEEAYDLVLASSGGIRSLTTEYTIKGDAKVYIQAYDAATHKVASSEVQAIQSLSGKGVTSIAVLDAAAARPAGCVAFPIGAKAAVFLAVKGLVDMDAEIDKARKKLQKSRGALEKQRKILGDPTYREKVAVATQEAERKRLADLESEARGFEGTIEQFEKLKLEE